jgi:hypothetical protein
VTGVLDEALRARSLEALGPLGHPTARRALEEGTVEVEHGVLCWEGSHGQVRGHRVVVRVSPELHADILEHPAAEDSLARAVGAAMASEPGQALADLQVVIGEGDGRARTAYRGRS